MGVNQLSDYPGSELTNTRSSRAACCLTRAAADKRFNEARFARILLYSFAACPGRHPRITAPRRVPHELSSRRVCARDPSPRARRRRDSRRGPSRLCAPTSRGGEHVGLGGSGGEASRRRPADSARHARGHHLANVSTSQSASTLVSRRQLVVRAIEGACLSARRAPACYSLAVTDWCPTSARGPRLKRAANCLRAFTLLRSSVKCSSGRIALFRTLRTATCRGIRAGSQFLAYAVRSSPPKTVVRPHRRERPPSRRIR
jgi:hypothetical protein